MHAVFAICLGACVGALARWQLGLWLNHPHALLPWGTLAANLIGGYLVGLILAWAHHADLAPVWRLMLADRWGQALTTIALHLLGSLTMTFVGIRTASLLVAR